MVLGEVGCEDGTGLSDHVQWLVVVLVVLNHFILLPVFSFNTYICSPTLGNYLHTV
jgi:hypothetical protein